MGLDTDMQVVLARSKNGVPISLPVIELSRATPIRGWMKKATAYEEPEDSDFYSFVSCGINRIIPTEVNHIREIESKYRQRLGPLRCSDDQEIYIGNDRFVRAKDLKVGTEIGNPVYHDRITRNRRVPRWPWQPYFSQVATIVLNPPVCDAITVRIGGYWGSRWTIKAVFAK